MDGWYLDTGATNHMTGRRDVFSELDTSIGIGGSVRFGDGSTASQNSWYLDSYLILNAKT